MSDPFRILTRFLDQFDLEVEGRSREEPPEEIRSRLRRFAAGTLDRQERAELVQLLRDHPDWVRSLAGEIKALRPPPASD